MLPFLLLATRAEDAAADDEYAAFLRFGGLEEGELHRVRMERDPEQISPGDLDRYSAVILGGSPYTWSTPRSAKTEAQLRSEAEIDRLLVRIVGDDLPFLGACYGIGTLGGHVGADVDSEHSEPVSAVRVRLTEAGTRDRLTSALPAEFDAFVAHKEAISRLPPHAVLLASSASCPVQAFRVGTNVYATQFHPELDVPGLQTRIEAYKYAGYFPPSTADALKAEVAQTSVVDPPRLLRRFIELYAR